MFRSAFVYAPLFIYLVTYLGSLVQADWGLQGCRSAKIPINLGWPFCTLKHKLLKNKNSHSQLRLSCTELWVFFFYFLLDGEAYDALGKISLTAKCSFQERKWLQHSWDPKAILQEQGLGWRRCQRSASFHIWTLKLIEVLKKVLFTKIYIHIQIYV